MALCATGSPSPSAGRSGPFTYQLRHGAGSVIYPDRWQWVSPTDEGQENVVTTEVPILKNYTLLFDESRMLGGRADCNQFSGSYTQENNCIQITLGPSTMAFCGEESLDTLYLQTLGQIVAGGAGGEGNLALETAGGAQRMVFRAAP